uniref:Uncharacterized protein n=1 Tax=Podoviridae sp. ct2nF21 TaxID=2826537 RepID=A0A8S5NFY4_9CAUD|nr:MAG TPA: hypothetical protein [Podoviridae sp. ct2nF21]
MPLFRPPYICFFVRLTSVDELTEWESNPLKVFRKPACQPSMCKKGGGVKRMSVLFTLLLYHC